MHLKTVLLLFILIPSLIHAFIISFIEAFAQPVIEKSVINLQPYLHQLKRIQFNTTLLELMRNKTSRSPDFKI